MKKWNSKVDQYFEDKIWTSIPKKDRTPHMMFMIGFISGLVFSLLITIIIL